MPDWLEAGRTVVITGAASGIGLAAANRFAATGMNVVIADNNAEALAAAEAQLISLGEGDVLAVNCDVSQPEDLLALQKTCAQRFGAVDCLMNNAGAAVTRAKPWEDAEGWRRQLEINLWGIIHGCQAFIPAMLAAGRPATIINTGSKQGITNPPGGYAYNLSKAGVLAYTQSLAHALREEAGAAINVHLLVPGFTYSGMIARFVPEQPPGAWSCEAVIDYLLAAIDDGQFCVICPDNDTPRELDNRRIQWHADDLIKGRPALSRWHPDFVAAYEEFISGAGAT